MIWFSLLACSGAPAPSGGAPAPREAPAPKAPTGTPLAALVATSGDAGPLLDGDPKTPWRPTGDPRNEGVLFRFEQLTQVSEITYRSCGAGSARLATFIDGSELDAHAELGPDDATVKLGPSWKIRSVFVRVDAMQPDACLGEVVFGGMDVAAPRRIGASVTASSTLEPDDAYHAAYLFDSRTDFGWVEGSEGLGLGQSVSLTLDSPLEITALELWNGYQRSEDHFKKNARATRIRFSVDGTAVELDVPDTMGPSKLALPASMKGKQIAIELLTGVKGSRYPDLVLSELRLWDADGPLSIDVAGEDVRGSELRAQAKGTDVQGAIDQLLVSHCDPAARQLKLRSNHSFVWYEADGPESEVFDGAWVLRGKKGVGTEIQLFGRRHRTELDWSPYGTGDVVDTVRIAGGKPVVTEVADLDRSTFTRRVAAIAKASGRDCAYDHGALAAAGAVLIESPAITDVLTPGPG